MPATRSAVPGGRAWRGGFALVKGREAIEVSLLLLGLLRELDAWQSAKTQLSQPRIIHGCLESGDQLQWRYLAFSLLLLRKFAIFLSEPPRLLL